MVSINRGFLMLSATVVTSFGILTMVAPEVVLPDVQAPALLLHMYGVNLLGWGAGKWAAVLAGSEEAVTAFATYNLCPCAMLVFVSMPPNGQPWMALFFLAGYLYIVTTGPRKAAASTSWPIGFYFLCFSASLVTCGNIGNLYAPEAGLAQMGLKYSPSLRLLLNQMAIAGIGWGVGKWSCIYNGDVAIQIFCKVNLFAMFASLGVSFLSHQYPMVVFALIFITGYGYLALTGPPNTGGEKQQALLG